MKDIHKNPTLYYILVPIMVALWPLIIKGIYLPNTERSLNEEVNNYKQARNNIAEILLLDGGRLDFSDSKTGASEFDYVDAVDKVADLCKISPAKYQLSSKPIISRDKQKSQNCYVALTDVNIATFAKFLSTIQLRWARLECVDVRLTKKKGLADTWKVDLNFKYHFKTG
jgi:hypothetical protein